MCTLDLSDMYIYSCPQACGTQSNHPHTCVLQIQHVHTPMYVCTKHVKYSAQTDAFDIPMYLVQRRL